MEASVTFSEAILFVPFVGALDFRSRCYRWILLPKFLPEIGRVGYKSPEVYTGNIHRHYNMCHINKKWCEINTHLRWCRLLKSQNRVYTTLLILYASYNHWIIRLVGHGYSLRAVIGEPRTTYYHQTTNHYYTILYNIIYPTIPFATRIFFFFFFEAWGSGFF